MGTSLTDIPMNTKKYLSRLAMALGFAVLLTSIFAKAPTDPVQVRLEFDRPVLPADSMETVIVKVALEGARLPAAGKRPPVNIALVIDRSSSMHGDKIVKAREAALEMLSRLAPDDRLAIVAYDSSVETLVPAQLVGDGREIADVIRAIRPRGMTALFGGVSQGASEVRKAIADVRFSHRVILLSDGQANVGPNSPDDLGNLGGALMKEGISVTTIGLGLGYNEDLMTRLAQRSDGNTYFVESSEELPRIFAAELGDVLNVVARRLVVDVEFAEGVRPVRFVGREGELTGRRAQVRLNQVYGGQEKFALIEVEVPSQRKNSRLPLATARVNFEDAVSARTVTRETRGEVYFTDDRAAVVKSANQRVQADYALNRAAESRDAAIALMDERKPAAAASELRARAAEMRSVATTYSNRQLSEIAAKQEAEADRLEREGLGNEGRKSYRALNAQTANQQSTSNR